MVSLAPFVLRRPWLTKMLMPAASWYANAAGYRKLGLRYEHLCFGGSVVQLPQRKPNSCRHRRCDYRKRIQSTNYVFLYAWRVNWMKRLGHWAGKEPMTSQGYE